VTGVLTAAASAFPPAACHRAVGVAALPSGVTVVHVPAGGGRATVGLSEAGAVPFELSGPARRIPGYRGQRNMPGWWWSATMRSHVVYESWLERHHLMVFDRLPQVRGISGQPFAFSWPVGVRRERHIPDLFVRFADGGGLVVDCRPVARADENFHRVAALSKAACDEVGWEYRLAGEPDPVLAANLTWLAGYRRPYVLDERTAASLLDDTGDPVPLLAAARAAIRSRCCRRCSTCCGRDVCVATWTVH
jgi:hypothetical protein